MQPSATRRSTTYLAQFTGGGFHTQVRQAADSVPNVSAGQSHSREFIRGLWISSRSDVSLVSNRVTLSVGIFRNKDSPARSMMSHPALPTSYCLEHQLAEDHPSPRGLVCPQCFARLMQAPPLGECRSYWESQPAAYTVQGEPCWVYNLTWADFRIRSLHWSGQQGISANHLPARRATVDVSEASLNRQGSAATTAPPLTKGG